MGWDLGFGTLSKIRLLRLNHVGLNCRQLSFHFRSQRCLLYGFTVETTLGKPAFSSLCLIISDGL